MSSRFLFASAVLALVGCAQIQPVTAEKTVVVFFTADSAALDPAARTAVEAVANSVKQQGTPVVHVRGYAAPDAGSTAFNQSLSRTRAEAVADALVSAGIPRGRLSMETRGAVPYDLMPTESRRVEILIGS